MPTSQLGLAQDFDESTVAAQGAGSRPQVRKHSLNSVGRTLCVIVFDETLYTMTSDLQSALVQQLRRCGETTVGYTSPKPDFTYLSIVPTVSSKI
jgi:hypothetical protein